MTVPKPERPPLQKALRLPLEIDAASLFRELQRIERDAWVQHFNTAYYAGDWDVISLRSTTGEASQIYPDPTKHNFVDTDLLKSSPAFQAALAVFRCPLLGVRLMRLSPGSSILEHRDHCLSFEDGEIRVHIPVKTNPFVEFYLDGERIVMGEGEAWYLNLNYNHRVVNKGHEERVHLVVDCTVNGWLRDLAGAPS